MTDKPPLPAVPIPPSTSTPVGVVVMQPQDERRVVEVGGWMTKCMVCKGNVIDGSDNTHKVAGGGRSAEPQKPGCGVVWTHVDATYPEHKEQAMKMYPGLIWAGWDGPRGDWS